MAPTNHQPVLLEVDSLSTHFESGGQTVRAVDQVSFQLRRGEVLGLVGESGSGKSATALSIMGLLDNTSASLGGRIVFEGQNLLDLSKSDMRQIRGRRIAMVFQDPMTSLNPVLPIGLQIGEALQTHLDLNKRQSRVRAAELLDLVGIPSAAKRLDDYQHQFSGGMRQRVMIAMALSCEPSILIADEPTTALDVTIQAQILELIKDLQEQMGMAVLLITHDLGVAAGTCDRINVMYAGRIFESGSVDEVFEASRMPYTWGLIQSIPGATESEGRLLKAIEGSPPELTDQSIRCRFAPRCEYVRSICERAEPDLTERVSDSHVARCFGTESDGWIVGRP
jgi:oligopeptide transport system ATP-binding protein